MAISTAVKLDQVQISFQDEGIGISETVREKIFEPFFTTKEEGIGLGLCITRRIIESHSGKICIESKKEKGTNFIISLPMT